MPWGRDQPGVAARAEKVGVAKVIQRADLTEERLERAIDEVLNDPSYSDQARIASERLQSRNWVEVACEYIEGM